MNEANLAKGKPFQPGVSGNPAGKKKGTIDMSRRIRRVLNHNIDWSKVTISDPSLIKLKKRYGNITVAEALIWVQVSKALTGDTQAFNSVVERGWGKIIKLEEDHKIEVVHILKPEKLEAAQLESEAERLRQRALDSIQEAEVVDELDSPGGSAELRVIDTR